jgi:hypothetical protein
MGTSVLFIYLIDAPGALHHIIIRGIERKAIFKDTADRENFSDGNDMDSKTIMLCLLVVGFIGGAPPTFCQEKQVTGWVETVLVCPEQLMFRAKVDTGAKNSSLNAHNIEIFQREGRKWVRFTVQDRNQRRLTLEKQQLRIAQIRENGGISEKRPAVMLGICLGSVYREVEVNLTDRASYNYQMLIGRSFLNGTFIVDTSITFQLRPECPGNCSQ